MNAISSTPMLPGPAPTPSPARPRLHSLNRRFITACALWILPLALLMTLPALVQAQFNYDNVNGTITITGTTNIPVRVEACANLSPPTWVPLQSLRLTNGSVYFSDSQGTNSPGRFYRLRSP